MKNHNFCGNKFEMSREYQEFPFGQLSFIVRSVIIKIKKRHFPQCLKLNATNPFGTIG